MKNDSENAHEQSCRTSSCKAEFERWLLVSLKFVLSQSTDSTLVQTIKENHERHQKLSNKYEEKVEYYNLSKSYWQNYYYNLSELNEQ